MFSWEHASTSVGMSYSVSSFHLDFLLLSGRNLSLSLLISLISHHGSACVIVFISLCLLRARDWVCYLVLYYG